MDDSKQIAAKNNQITDKILKQLGQQIGRLPGVNFRQAKKISAYILSELVKSKSSGVNSLISMLSYAKENATQCYVCHNIFFDDHCDVCDSDGRPSIQSGKQNIICVVENLYELWRMQQIDNCNFYYHIIGGIISASGGVMPNDLNLPSLIERIRSNEQITEVIIMLNKSYDGIITTNYIADVLNKAFNSDGSNMRIIISTPADGLPQGTNFDFIDERTFELSLTGRRQLNLFSDSI